MVGQVVIEVALLPEGEVTQRALVQLLIGVVLLVVGERSEGEERPVTDFASGGKI